METPGQIQGQGSSLEIQSAPENFEFRNGHRHVVSPEKLVQKPERRAAAPDSGRGGKHNVRLVQKKATIQHIPTKEEIIRTVDMAGNLRDKGVLLTLFQSGIKG